MAFNPLFADAISSIESGGKYDILGPPTKSGDQAYGKYQTMGVNIGPWTKEILGKELTPQEFLANPQAQDAVFQGKFGQYVDKYGPEGAAQAWIGGPGGVGKLDRKDSLGTSIRAYGQKFMAALGSGGGQNNAPATVPAAQIPQQPAQPGQMPAFPWSPGVQQQQGQQAQSNPAFQQSPPLVAPPPIQFAQRKPPDLTRLNALLANAPASVRALLFRG